MMTSDEGKSVILVGVDTGGTFTDFVFKHGDQWDVYKLPSTASDPAEAVLNGIRHVAGGQNIRIVHGSTVATNAILERKGAVTALITNKGFEDVIEIGRQNRKDLYNLFYRKPPALVPENLRFGIDCRVNCYGDVVREIDEAEIKKVAEKLGDAKVESAAVSFLFSFKNPAHEIKVGKMLSKLGISVSLSHEILPEFREYERTSTTIVNAYVSPKMKAYIEHITRDSGTSRLRVMQSNGGSISGETAIREPVRTILSGPAGGVVGAYEIGKMAGHQKLITFDMGGTSTDVSLIDKKLPFTTESAIAQFPLKVPMLDIHTVGAGGGSIAYLDSGGSLNVGPESAGSDPGPICYGRGSRITVTDANLFLGRIFPDRFLGGNMTLYPEKLGTFFRRMGKSIGLNEIELAEGILSVANAAMERAIRVISVERGFDPADFTLFSFGGAGGMHAPFLATLLNIPRVFIPGNPGILSAMGMMMADIVKDYSQTVMLGPQTELPEKISRLFLPLEKSGLNDLVQENLDPGRIVLEKYLDMRYQGQAYEITVSFGEDFIEEFHRLHQKNYGYCNRDGSVEIVNIRLRAKGGVQKPVLPKSRAFSRKITSEAVIDARQVVFDGQKIKTNIISRDRLVSGNIIEGPAVLVEYSATTLIPPHAFGVVDEYGNMVITL
jgi:N-methylhydantoinase A